MGVYWSEVDRADGFNPAPAGPDGHDKDSDEAPETPLDEPRPPRVQAPPQQPEQKGPYAVRAQSW
jgi:hypothetical protein